ncbi:hypothetical protein AV530_005945 [Patagioenas fasciata monilis]|uniref:Uncharacterized protein n=1 Tax=Patagioenas fasciata monilis TaxID=372326 RepID=A0A1V4JN61_PATFA|nr:hypothetical protein AV530_005945 [Patagioenas fasciata monilis]
MAHTSKVNLVSVEANRKMDDDLHLCLCSPEYLQDSSMYMERQGGKIYQEKTARNTGDSTYVNADPFGWEYRMWGF